MQIDNFNLSVRLNGNNIIPIQALSDEIPVLKGVWGEENLIIDKAPCGALEVASATEEASRLIAKYGRKAVEDVYGKDAINLEGKLKPSKRVAATAAK